ncbi:alpha/beta-hydrolase [Ophiobolus disseminans]|uniref:Carboxypeptidase n=1 Tax=Ophiobolus disseminans TaxID=1469910 RepID=A0A6A7ADC7_9PLEO|nr:alpha/beta-hydrolase [Ophiobolus disseminans]
MVQLSPIVLASLITRAATQQFPLPVSYDTILTSPINSNITISYKQPTPGTCATAFESQKQYSGYVNLPPFTLAPYQQNYSINTFFWFFESRTNPETAPLTIWLSGGPGSSSMVGLFQELGPCEMKQHLNGTYGTQPRPFGWDRSSNMLFIDQPTQTGFSYDERVNASVDFAVRHPFILESRLQPQAPLLGAPTWRVANGTFASGRHENTQDSTAIAARACWHFLQGFLSAFPQYNPGTRPNQTTVEPAGVNLFAESYGGLYGPTFADYFEDQNDRRRTGILPQDTLEVRLDSVGIINGLVDYVTEAISIANFLRNNTYGIAAIDLLAYQNAISTLNSDTGCRGLVASCRNGMHITDPENSGLDTATNKLCRDALDACNHDVGVLYKKAGKSPYDIRLTPDAAPSAAYQEYLNTDKVMQSIGAQVNFTQTSMAVFDAFAQVGDAVRGTQLKALSELLARGIRVALIYGDADIICNWYGGQNASLELARLLPSYSDAFPAAGYADIIVNDTYVGGHVRQFGNLSFSRIFDAGHLVPLYQPETAFTVFSRIIQGDDLSTGRNINLSTHGTVGIRDSSSRSNKIPVIPSQPCWIRDVSDSCTEDEKAAIKQGQGVVNNGIWTPVLASVPAVKPDGAPQSTPQAQDPPPAPQITTKTTTKPLIGVFTATKTPTPVPTSTSGASSRKPGYLPRRQASPTVTIRSRNVRTRYYGVIIGGTATGGFFLFSVIAGLAYMYIVRARRKKLSSPTKDLESAPDSPQNDTNAFSRRLSRMEPIPEHSAEPSNDVVDRFNEHAARSDEPVPQVAPPTYENSQVPKVTPQDPRSAVEGAPEHSTQPSSDVVNGPNEHAAQNNDRVPQTTPPNLEHAQEPSVTPQGPSLVAAEGKLSLLSRIKASLRKQDHKADDAQEKRVATPPPRTASVPSPTLARSASVPADMARV